MRKTCPGSYVKLDLRVHLACTLAVYALLLLFGGIVRLRKVQPIRLQRIYHWFITILTPASAILFFVKIHSRDLGIHSCSFSSWNHIMTLSVDTYFFFRFLVEILEGHFPDPLSIIDCWLLVNTVWKTIKFVVISEYHFLVLARFLYSQTLEMYAVLLTRLFGVQAKKRVFQFGLVIIGVFIFGGAIQTAEEWSVLLGIHPDADGQVTVWHSYWDYIYMGYVTVSTVGYGDMLPSTIATQAIVVIAIIAYIAWYADSCAEIYSAVKGMVTDIVGCMPPRPLHRRVVVVGCLEEDKMKQLVDELTAQKETQIIVGIKKGEHLSLPKIPGVFVIRDDLNISFYRSCFPPESLTDHPSDALMVLNQEGDLDKVGALDSDLHVLSLVQMVKAVIPGLPIIAQVWRRETRIAMETIESWWPIRDKVVSHEEVMAGLLTQSIAASGAGSIIANLITPTPITVTPVIHNCTEALTNAYLWGRSLTVALSNDESQEEDSFDEAALKYYAHDRVLVLGYVEENSRDRCYILPSSLPSNAPRILLVPSNLVSADGTANIPAAENSSKIHNSSNSLTPHIRVKEKTVWVAKDSSSENLAQTASSRNLHVVSQEDIDEFIDAVAILESYSEPDKALYDYYCTKAYLADFAPMVPLLTNLEHGLEPGVKTISADCPNACTTYINSRIVTSAVCSAYDSDFSYRLWKYLVFESRVLEVEIKGHHCYGKMFHYLLTRCNMLAIGATVLIDTHSRDACTETLKLDPNHKGELAITNPDFDFCLHPGDKVVALPLAEGSYSL